MDVIKLQALNAINPINGNMIGSDNVFSNGEGMGEYETTQSSDLDGDEFSSNADAGDEFLSEARGDWRKRRAEKRALKSEKKKAKIDIKRARADKKRATGEAKMTKASAKVGLAEAQKGAAEAAKIGAAQPGLSPEATLVPEKTGMSMGAKIGIGVGIAAVLGVIIFVVMKKKNASK